MENDRNEQEVDTLRLDQEIREVRAEVAFQNNVRMVMTALSSSMLFVAVVSLALGYFSAAKFIFLFALFFCVAWTAWELQLAHSSKETK